MESKMHLSTPNGKPHLFKSEEQETLVCTLLTGLVFIGALLYELFYVEKLPLMFDEFQYLFKGDQFIKGIYSTYQEYGFYMNKMPIPFYLFGLAQQIGGIGLRTGRLFSIIAVFSTIFVYWKITARLAGKWAGLFIALTFVINPSLMGIYSLADSQAMSAFFFAICLWIIAIETPKPWQIILNAFFTAILILVRVNLFPMAIFIVVYNFWVNGKRAGFTSLFSFVIFLVIGHLPFLPGILQMWIIPLPQVFKDLLPFYEPISGVEAWAPTIELTARVHSFWETIRLNFISIVGFLDALLFLRLNKKKMDKSQIRILCLSVLFIFLYLLHAWETLTKERCVYCLTPYYAFFYGLGVLIFILSISHWDLRNKARNRWAFCLNFLILAGVGFSTFIDLGNVFLKIQVPRIKGFKILSGTTEISALLHNKFALSLDFQKMILSPLVFIVAGVLLFIIVTILNRYVLKRKLTSTFLFCIAVLLVGFLLTPTILFSGSYYNGQLTCNTIPDLELVAADLAQKIPAGATVYWGSTSSAYPLLYLTDFDYFPSQLGTVYSQRIGGDADELERQGYWNEEISERWFDKADIILVNNEEFPAGLRAKIDPTRFDELSPTPALNCQDPLSFYRIYIRKSN
ncbi:MAG: ArnT family glycosyltransferase [Anaerolineaceae bacterium]